MRHAHSFQADSIGIPPGFSSWAVHCFRVRWNSSLEYTIDVTCMQICYHGFDIDNMCGSSVLTPSLFQILIVWAPANWKPYILATELVRKTFLTHLSRPRGLTFWSGGWLGRSRRIQTVSSLQESKMSHCKIGAYRCIRWYRCIHWLLRMLILCFGLMLPCVSHDCLWQLWEAWGRGTSEIEAMLIFDTHIVLGATLQAPRQPAVYVLLPVVPYSSVLSTAWA